MWRRIPIVFVAVGLAVAVAVVATLELFRDWIPGLFVFLGAWMAVSATASSAVWRYVGSRVDVERSSGPGIGPVYEYHAGGRTVTVRHQLNYTRGGPSGSGKSLAGTKTTYVATVDGVEDSMRIDVEERGVLGRWRSESTDYRTGHDEFDERFVVSCSDSGRARAVLTPSLRDALLALPGSPNVTLDHRKAVIRYTFPGWVGTADPAILERCAEAAATAARAVEDGCGTGA